jgi:hypothetical protein
MWKCKECGSNKKSSLKEICKKCYMKKHLKETNYKSERTPYQRMIRSIKRSTRNYFKIEGHKCEFCGNKATEHHHNTVPIEFDKFNYLCHECHNKIPKKQKGDEE